LRRTEQEVVVLFIRSEPVQSVTTCGAC